MAKGCLYCGLQLPDTADFCPECGRPIERGFVIRSIQESELDSLHKEMNGSKDLLAPFTQAHQVDHRHHLLAPFTAPTK